MKKTLITALMLLVSLSGLALAQTTPATSDSTGRPLKTSRRVVESDRVHNGSDTVDKGQGAGRYDERVLDVGDQSRRPTTSRNKLSRSNRGIRARTTQKARRIRTTRGSVNTASVNTAGSTSRTSIRTSASGAKTGGTSHDTHRASMQPHTRPASNHSSPSSVINSGGGPR